MTASIAITGLRTFLGRRLAERLAQHSGQRVVGIDRARPYGLHRDVRFQEVDLVGSNAAAELADVFAKQDVERVVQLAFRREPTPDLEADYALEAIGNLHLLRACAAARVPHLLVGSTTMTYGARPDNPNFLSEEHPLRGHPDAHCVLNRVEVERQVADFAARHPETAVTVLRPCWIFGPTHMDAVVRYFARPVVPVVMGYDPLLQMIHEEDCLRAFERATLESHPGVFNLVAPEPVPLSVLLRSAGRRPLPLPAPLLYRLPNTPSAARTGDRSQGFTDYLRYLWVADGARGFEAFGRPRYTTREAWMSFVAAHRLQRFR